MTSIFDPLTIGDVHLPNRIIMAPLTRSRAANPGRVPNQIMAEYYAQRADAGLILTEATCISPMGIGYADTPGIWSNDQVEGWAKVTKAVHEKGGRIFVQLWHVGRISHPLLLDGALPVAPSAIKPKGHVSLIRPIAEYVTPRALETSEVQDLVAQYKLAAENAKRAGFDGVEIHAANGYLIDQFLQDSTNKRTDEYGGPIENRARFLLEIVDAAIAVWGHGRVGVHLAPRMDSHDMGDSHPAETFTYVARELSRRQIGFIFTRERQGDDSITPLIKREFGGIVIANEAFDLPAATEAVRNGSADAVAFGKAYIANPDLVKRLKGHLALNTPDASTFYSGGEKGYTDYPFNSGS